MLLVLLKWALGLGPSRWLGQLAWRLRIRFDISDKERPLNVFTENKSQSQSRGRKVMLSQSRGSVPLGSLLLSGFSTV